MLRYEDSARIQEHLEFHLDRITTLIEEACRNRQFDLVFGCLAVPDLAHHYFWRGDTPEALEPIYRLYEAVDRAIGRFAALAGPDDYFLVCSDHGGGPAPRRTFAVNRWLQKSGYLSTSASLERFGGIRLANRIVIGARRLRLNQRLGPRLPKRLRSRASLIAQNGAFVDWGRTRAYGINFFYPLVGLEVNQRRRQARGIVPAGAATDAVVSDLMAKLATLEDDTGRRVCRSVHRGADLFEGPHVERFPDVVGVLDPDYDTRVQLVDQVFGENTMQWEYPYLGYHDEHAMLVLRGPDVPADVTASTVPLIDVPPTILQLLGVAPPPWMTGRAFAGGCAPAFSSSPPR
jgi:predicted AlkP superfamily phosphohydrolase/phosphomutase